MQDTKKIVCLRQGKLSMSHGNHRNQRRSLRATQRSQPLISFEKRPQMVKMHPNIFTTIVITH